MPPNANSTSDGSFLNWQRFWCPLDGKLRLDSDGFLQDPRRDYGELFQPDAKPMSVFDDVPCLILLGEPGMGKSVELERHANALAPALRVVRRNLRAYDSTSALGDDILRSAVFEQWRDGSGTLTLVLDSLDEALTEIRPLGAWLLSQLEEMPTDRLRMRIACRTADWPLFLHDGLQKLWGKEKVSAIELAPLCRADALIAAEAAAVNANRFLQEVRDREIGPIAAKPTTLFFLLSTFRDKRELPRSTIELYHNGCLHLCREDNERLESKRGGLLGAEERLAVAARIAAVTVIGNRSLLWRNESDPAVSGHALGIGDLLGGTEPAGPQRSVPITRAAVTETIGTALFSGRGINAVGWAHQTYAEFLAARWIAQVGMPLTQIESLILRTGEPGRPVVPQLREMVAWLAGMHPGVRALMLRTDPELILSTDPESVSDTERADAVNAIFEIAEAGTRAYAEWGTWHRYDRLQHPQINEQLAAVVSDPGKRVDVRELAVTIGRAAGATKLQGLCAELALTSENPLELRVEAARLVADVGDVASRRRLIPLALDPQPDDTEDDLKGVALRAVWRELLTGEQIFAALSAPKRPNLSGAYDFFFYDLIDGVTGDMVIPGLEWASRLVNPSGIRRRLADTIVREAWQHLNAPEVLAAFVDLAIRRFNRHESVVDEDHEGEFRSLISRTPNQRRAMVQALVQHHGAGTDLSICSYTPHHWPLVTRDDIDWLLEQCKCDSPELAVACASLLTAVIDRGEPDDFERLYAHREVPAVANQFGHWWRPMELTSDEARELRASHKRREEFARRQESTQASMQLPSSERVAQMLGVWTAADSADSRATADLWPAVAWELTRSAKGECSWRVDLDVEPSWELLSSNERSRVLDLAAAFINSCAGEVREWVSRTSIKWGALAGIGALYLVHHNAPERLTTLSPEVWTAWIPALIHHHAAGNDERVSSTREAILSLAYSEVPQEVTSLSIEELVAEDAGSGPLWILEELESLLANELRSAMLRLLKSGQLAPRGSQALLERLVKLRVPEAEEYARLQLNAPLRDAAGRERVLAAAVSLLLFADDGGWPAVRSALRRSKVLRRRTALAIAHRMSGAERFSDGALAEMFSWLTKEFPYPDPGHDGVFSPSNEDGARQLRGQLLNVLSERGTESAIKGLEWLKCENPQFPGLSRTLARARDAFGRSSWHPPRIHDLLELAKRTDNRWIASGTDLLAVLQESLERFEADLHGELPAISSLWNDLGAGEYRPKDEGDLSDAIARHIRADLLDRGIIVGREVVIRRGGAPGIPGQRTDLYVTAVRQLPEAAVDQVATIIEIKCCWNRDVLTAIETQLAGDYLRRNPRCRHGLYVVGWYVCPRWQDEPRLRKARRLGDAESVARKLMSAAAHLSTNSVELRAIVIDASWP